MGIDYFKILAPIYDWGRRKYDPRQLIKFLDLHEPGTLLDVGGGTGRVGSLLVEIASKIVITDKSIDMLHQALDKSGIYSVCSLSEKLPFPENYFDREIIVDALHHVEDQKLSISEMWRVLKPGGFIIIEEVDITKMKGKMIEFMEKVLMMNSHFLLPNEIMALFNGYKCSHQVTLDGLTTWVVVKKLE